MEIPHYTAMRIPRRFLFISDVVVLSTPTSFQPEKHYLPITESFIEKYMDQFVSKNDNSSRAVVVPIIDGAKHDVSTLLVFEDLLSQYFLEPPASNSSSWMNFEQCKFAGGEEGVKASSEIPVFHKSQNQTMS